MTPLPRLTSNESFQAAVVCRQLGFEAVAEVKIGSHFGQSYEPFVFGDVNCDGNEQRLADCERHDESFCSPDRVAGVVCVPGTPSSGKSLRAAT